MKKKNKIFGFDDCYETYIDSLEEFNNSEGIEVYSILTNRRITPERFWDGETN